MTDTLFEGYEAQPAADDGLSADRKRTLRQRRDVANGIHPLTGYKSRPDLGTCGDCRFREVLGHHNYAFPKCTVGDGQRMTHGAGSDVRAWWPACDQFELGDNKVGPDAARWRP